MTQLSIYKKQDESVGFRAHRQVWLSPCYYLKSACTTGPKATILHNTLSSIPN